MGALCAARTFPFSWMNPHRRPSRCWERSLVPDPIRRLVIAAFSTSSRRREGNREGGPQRDHRASRRSRSESGVADIVKLGGRYQGQRGCLSGRHDHCFARRHHLCRGRCESSEWVSDRRPNPQRPQSAGAGGRQYPHLSFGQNQDPAADADRSSGNSITSRRYFMPRHRIGLW